MNGLDFKGAKEPGSQFLRLSSQRNLPGEEANFLSALVGRRRHTTVIVQPLISLHGLEENCPCGPLQPAGAMCIVLNGRHSQLTLHDGVMAVFDPCQLITSHGLVREGNTTKDGFQLLICPLHLAVSLGVEIRGQTDLAPQFRTKLLPQLESELQTPVRDDVLRNTMQLEKMLDELFGGSQGSRQSRQCHKMGGLGKPVDYSEDGGVTNMTFSSVTTWRSTLYSLVMCCNIFPWRSTKFTCSDISWARGPSLAGQFCQVLGKEETQTQDTAISKLQFQTVAPLP